MTPYIRLRQDSDLNGCVQALAMVFQIDAYPTNWPPDPVRWLTPSNVWQSWVAADGSSILGHILLRRSQEHASVSRLFVVPRARGHGVAAALLATTCSAARDWSLDLEVADHNRAAMRLYERTGWRRLDSYRADWLDPTGVPALVHRYIPPIAHQR